jgi:hypothetical protein
MDEVQIPTNSECFNIVLPSALNSFLVVSHIFLPQYLCLFLLSQWYFISLPFHRPRFNGPNHDWWMVAIMEFHAIQSLPTSVYSVPLPPNSLLSALYSNTIFCFCRSLKDRLCGLVVRVPGYRSRGYGFDSRRYQIFFWEVVGLERGPLKEIAAPV